MMATMDGRHKGCEHVWVLFLPVTEVRAAELDGRTIDTRLTISTDFEEPYTLQVRCGRCDYGFGNYIAGGH